MIFSRFLLVALAAVGVVAHSASPHKRGMVKVPLNPMNLGIREYSASPYQSAVAKLKDYQEQTSDAIAGPPSEREAKLVSITAGLLEVVKAYNSDFKSKFSLLDLSNIAKSGEMSDFGRKLYVILRSCKGTRSEGLYNNIHEIGAEVDAMGDFMASKLPSTLAAMVLPAFARYSDKIDMIEMATKAY
ncbi:unnamed protein product [Rhizoctonia solani]|uniref:Uncharacterized protein n=1 Tax=Rhizoctonia solani TaxID=456999 RepID=A0A8H2WU14_9AGAM|nr:unnamed protein product [Rhizoctonia solani]CAE6475445.1 unnamed protein product [Rhizoctonia solani]